MACANLLLVTLLAGASPGLAEVLREGSSTAAIAISPVEPAHISTRPIDLSIAPVPRSLGITSLSNDSERSWLQGEPWRSDARRPEISVGPLRAGFGAMNGRRAQFATVRLDGVSVFGGTIGGGIDGRSAHLMLSWPTSP